MNPIYKVLNGIGLSIGLVCVGGFLLFRGPLDWRWHEQRVVQTLEDGRGNLFCLSFARNNDLDLGNYNVKLYVLRTNTEGALYDLGFREPFWWGSDLKRIGTNGDVLISSFVGPTMRYSYGGDLIVNLDTGTTNIGQQFAADWVRWIMMDYKTNKAGH